MTDQEKQELKKIIETKRAEMIKVAFEEGFTSTNTVRISQEIDKLMNRLDGYK